MSQTVKKEIWDWTKAIIIAFVLAFVIRNYIFATSIVEGTSMDPTLKDGERVMYNKIVYIMDNPERGDIVIIQRPTKNYVKRVIGLPGDEIQVKGHELYVNGKKSEQEYLNEQAIRQTGDFGPRSVPKDHYFVMGDNRDISKDSRNGLGFIKRDEVIGRSELVIYPFDELDMTR
ncbi:signal peptidase I [Pontibacillus yanchengensis]|uniref:Signal peptidase I n=2 Tax=Pontibacillus yanchengensis TaxID=462910 RepID=A0ACC7VC08_9BACI|nr:signal peptidase I [Pontibacillus yanchengensis]MYL34792.1 signal peptidase I [Pontibacillus yanchengensis]MYL52222.1 signal peptidase I [Pontibacillus yanchengensis]